MTEQLVFSHWTMDQLKEARRIAIEVMKDYGDIVGDEYEKFFKNPWNDHCSVQAALRAMPKATDATPDQRIAALKEAEAALLKLRDEVSPAASKWEVIGVERALDRVRGLIASEPTTGTQ